MKKQKRDTEKNLALGKRIKRFREKADLSQEELAVKVRLTQTSISLIETGKRGVSIATLQKIANALGVKVSELFPF
jgi:transcriptional regulator with XRE-family HTH domain